MMITFRAALMLTPVLLGTALMGAAPARAAGPEQFIPIPDYRVGPYAAGGTGQGGGLMDYVELINRRDGGVNGVKITFEECETEYEVERGVECYTNLIGKPEQVAERIVALKEAAVDLVFTGFLHFHEKVAYFGERVLPLVRQTEAVSVRQEAILF